MNVKLVGFTPKPEKIPAMAGMLTHSKSKPEDLENVSDDKLNVVLKEVTRGILSNNPAGIEPVRLLQPLNVLVKFVNPSIP